LSREVETSLKFSNLGRGDYTHLSLLAERWRAGVRQKRTLVSTDKVVTINVSNVASKQVALTFPDMSGEAFDHMWEARECFTSAADHLKARGATVLFIHADTIQSPQWVLDVVSLSRKLGVEVDATHPVSWSASLAPTQVKLVDMLQMLNSPPLAADGGKLAIVFSAWDKVAEERLSPSAFLATRLPLLDQYLRHGNHGYEFSIWGVSAQGGDYKGEDEMAPTGLEKLLALDQPSSRISVFGGEAETHDITEPIAWLVN
jgi:hypothetical protein